MAVGQRVIDVVCYLRLCQVYWVYDVLKQPRVIATDRDDNYISISLDYKQRFHVIEREKSIFILVIINYFKIMSLTCLYEDKYHAVV